MSVGTKRLGFPLKGNELNCFRKNECLAEDECGEDEVCLNISGQFFCRKKANPTCPDGYIGKFPDCEDFNECAAEADICPAGMVCANERGNFTCNCADGSQDRRFKYFKFYYF